MGLLPARLGREARVAPSALAAGPVRKEYARDLLMER